MITIMFGKRFENKVYYYCPIKSIFWQSNFEFTFENLRKIDYLELT